MAIQTTNVPMARQSIKAYALLMPLFERILSSPETNAQSQYLIASVYAIQNKIPESIAALEKAIEAGFNNQDLLDHDPNMTNSRESILFQDWLASQPSLKAFP